MTTEITKLNPNDYGLEESKVATIEQAFQPKILERDVLSQEYEALAKLEISPEVCKDMRSLRLKLVKVRTGIADIHKTQKAFYLAAGRFVDAWKEKETTPVVQMEEKLKEGEEYYERLEAKRIADLEASRTEQLNPYTDILPGSLGLLSDEAFTTYLTGAKVAYEARIKAEKDAEIEAAKQAEIIKQAAIRKERDDARFKIFAGTGAIFSNGMFSDGHFNYDFAELSELNDQLFDKTVQEATKKVAECKAAEIKEKERLEIIAKAKEKELAIQAETLRVQQENAAKEKAKQDAIIAKQQADLKAERDRLEAIAEADRKEQADKKEAAELAAKAPKKEKLTKWIDGLVMDAPAGLESDAVVLDVLAKFAGFKKWAKGQVEKI